MFYRVCIKILNQKELNLKVDNPWHPVLELVKTGKQPEDS